jgi:hypothetical protein
MYELSIIRSMTSPARLRDPEATSSRPVSLSDITESLGSGDRIGGLGRRGREEELQPLLDVALLSNRLKPLVILAAVLLEIRAEVQERLGQRPLLLEVEETQ